MRGSQNNLLYLTFLINYIEGLHKKKKKKKKKNNLKKTYSKNYLLSFLTTLIIAIMITKDLNENMCIVQSIGYYALLLFTM